MVLTSRKDGRKDYHIQHCMGIGHVRGERSRGRQRKRWMDNVREDLQERHTIIYDKWKDQEKTSFEQYNKSLIVSKLLEEKKEEKKKKKNNAIAFVPSSFSIDYLCLIWRSGLRQKTIELLFIAVNVVAL